MPPESAPPIDAYDLSFKVFHELMACRVQEILLISSPYDAFIMEEDGGLAERIVHEYRGLNLTRPPRLQWVSSAREALESLSRTRYDLVITMPRIDDMKVHQLGREIKRRYPRLTVFLLAHNSRQYVDDPRFTDRRAFDRLFEWRGTTDLLLALIKSVEDRLNVAYDTRRAGVRVIILVEDSPYHASALLPLLYREIVTQTQAAMEDSLNEEHRILRMRARPKILLAETFEEAEALYRQYQPYLLAVFSDFRFPRRGRSDPRAGAALMALVKSQTPDLAVLMMSSEELNRPVSEAIPAVFLNKTSPYLHTDIHAFFSEALGFGDFIFRTPDGTEIARASNLRRLENVLPDIPNESVRFHGARNDFSTWLMARSEILLALQLRPLKVTDFESANALKNFLIDSIHRRREHRQRGVITEFCAAEFDPDADFVRLGRGSLGGKARGLAFISTQLRAAPEIQAQFENVRIYVPKTLVISTEAFDAFIADNNLDDLASSTLSDEQIRRVFLQSRFPEWIARDLTVFLTHARHPLAVRSSSLLEDAQFQPFAGIYQTFMLPNAHPDPEVRCSHLIKAIKLVYASTYCEASRCYALRTTHRTEEEKMAVMVQQLTGRPCNSLFFPSFSGVAQSYNFYPIMDMKPEEGIAHIALGLGKTVVEGGAALRFSPHYPQLLPQFSTVDDILKNSQRQFYALDMTASPGDPETDEIPTLKRSTVDTVTSHPAVQQLCSTYCPDDHRIRDTWNSDGIQLVTFASVLKYRSFPIPEILTALLELGRKGMGTAVEIEFAVNLPDGRDAAAEFALLQLRPMGLRSEHLEVEIRQDHVEHAFCYSTTALGNGRIRDIADIVYVKPEDFDPARTLDIAAEISRINRRFVSQQRKYLLVGPGRWGSADQWLGIPVGWKDIQGIGALVETTHPRLQADPSQGSHFFHNITSLGISYITVSKSPPDFIDWAYLATLPAAAETRYLRHVAPATPLTILIDGKRSCAVILKTGLERPSEPHPTPQETADG